MFLCPLDFGNFTSPSLFPIWLNHLQKLAKRVQMKANLVFGAGVEKPDFVFSVCEVGLTCCVFS